jgi:hypothetical protein
MPRQLFEALLKILINLILKRREKKFLCISREWLSHTIASRISNAMLAKFAEFQQFQEFMAA